MIFLPVKTFLPLHGPFPALKNDIGCLLLSKVNDDDNDIMVLINGDNDNDDNHDLRIVVVDPLRASSHWRGWTDWRRQHHLKNEKYYGHQKVDPFRSAIIENTG